MKEEVVYKKKIRGFEVVSKYKDADVLLPKRSTEFSAGYDFFNNGEDITIEPNTISKPISTYTKAYMLEDEYLALHVRSSYGFKYSCRLVNSTGIIDKDYYNNEKNEGEIFVKLYNHGNESLTIKKGDSFAQGIFSKYYKTDNDQETVGGKRIGGIGSTTKDN